MKILHLLESSHFSGAENVVCQIIGMMHEEKNIEMVYSSRDGQIRQVLEERNIVFAPIKELTVKEVKRVIKEQQPDIIHAHDMRASFIAALACGKKSLVSHIHNNAFNSRGISKKSIAYLYAGLKAKHIFWVSDSSFKGYAFHRFLENKSSVLYNIVNIEELYSKMNRDLKEYDYDIVYLGRLTFQKNPQRLIRILKIVIEKLPKIKIAIIGTGDLEDETKKLAQEYGLLNNISFMGFQLNPLKILHDSKVMVMSSRWEGTPMCVLEAMALGVPIVSTPVDGLKDLVRSGENGYLSDDDNELANKILLVVRNKEVHRKWSEQVFMDAKRINDIEKYRSEILRAYKNK